MAGMVDFLELLGVVDVAGHEWRERAACRGADPELFFPGRTDADGSKREYARQVCKACSVQPECLDYSLQAREKHGIWGGLTELERKPLRRRGRGSAA
jgi:WhiB family redox-sensing transcriptional regulator